MKRMDVWDFEFSEVCTLVIKEICYFWKAICSKVLRKEIDINGVMRDFSCILN